MYAKRSGTLIFLNIHKNYDDENELRLIINQKISNLIKIDLSKGAIL